MPEKPKSQYLSLATLGQLNAPTNPGHGWVGPERPASTWGEIAADPLSALFDLGRGAVTGDAPVGMNVQGIGALLAAAMPVAQGAKALRAATKAAKLSNLTEEAAQAGIKAYHGSPHDFDKFSMEKIGTGEGAQAYGHGLYFAENPSVASGYKKAGVVDPRDAVGNAIKAAYHISGPDNLTPAVMRDWMVREGVQADHITPDIIDAALEAARGQQTDGSVTPAAIKAYQRLDRLHGELPKGKMYEVQIHASPDQFLDWDKPLSEQTPHVRQALEQAGVAPKKWGVWEPLEVTADHNFVGAKPGSWVAVERNEDGSIRAWNGQPFMSERGATENAAIRNGTTAGKIREKGEHLYSDAGQLSGLSKAEVSDKLRQAGIPGIRYLDAGSRAGGEGTRNFVIFDDSLVSILKKYGIALPVIEGLRERAKQNGGVISRQDVDSLQ